MAAPNIIRREMETATDVELTNQIISVRWSGHFKLPQNLHCFPHKGHLLPLCLLVRMVYSMRNGVAEALEN